MIHPTRWRFLQAGSGRWSGSDPSNSVERVSNKKQLILFVTISVLSLTSACNFQTRDISRYSELSPDSETYNTVSNYCSRIDPYVYVAPIRVDMDLDFMDDNWELRNQLDPRNPDDAEVDADGDGYTNREEYQAGSDPNLARYNPGIIEVTNLGFDCFYTAEIGYVNDDLLLDIVVRDPSEGYLPAIRDFVLVQQPDHSFSLEDAENFEIAQLTSIQSALVLANLNGDSSQDIVLFGLTNYIPEVNDQVIFGEIGEVIARGIHLDVIPFEHKELDSEFMSFFHELHQWTISQDYFDSNARILSTVPSILELDWILDEDGSTTDDCNVGFIRCSSVLADENDPVNSSIESVLSIEYFSSPYEVQISDGFNDPNEIDFSFQVKAIFSETPNLEVKDYSHFNQDALYLSRNEFLQILHDGVMLYPSAQASQIYRTLEEYLGSSVFSIVT